MVTITSLENGSLEVTGGDFTETIPSNLFLRKVDNNGCVIGKCTTNNFEYSFNLNEIGTVGETTITTLDSLYTSLKSIVDFNNGNGMGGNGFGGGNG
jgi:hypothetical protein